MNIYNNEDSLELDQLIVAKALPEGKAKTLVAIIDGDSSWSKVNTSRCATRVY